MLGQHFNVYGTSQALSSSLNNLSNQDLYSDDILKEWNNWYRNYNEKAFKVIFVLICKQYAHYQKKKKERERDKNKNKILNKIFQRTFHPPNR